MDNTGEENGSRWVGDGCRQKQEGEPWTSPCQEQSNDWVSLRSPHSQSPALNAHLCARKRTPARNSLKCADANWVSHGGPTERPCCTQSRWYVLVHEKYMYSRYISNFQ